MSVHLPPSDPVDTGSNDSSDEDDDNDQTWDDWVSDSAPQTCRSLFEDKVFPSASESLKHDRESHGFDLDKTCEKLSLDFHGRIRLINFIRRTKPTVAQVRNLTGKESFFSSDEYLRPVIEDDPLLQVQSEDWSDSDNENDESPVADTNHRVRILEKNLAKAKRDLEDYRSFVSEQLNLGSLRAAINDDSDAAPPPRDNDSHYFNSYGENDIHAVMIQDKVRTSTYASFIMKNPLLFRDAIVLDVGCGTGILSLFAAKSGAKRVFAIDASDIAEKADAIVKINGLENVITVIRGKVEDIKLPDGIEKVDIIISEWMGYALLYESMLDSVLRARDRFLKPGGVMAPSQSRMMLGLCDGAEIFKERVGFWNDIYGFDLSPMGTGVYDEAIVDVVGPETMVSEPYIVKDLHIGTITAKQLDFASPFSLTSTTERRTKVHALVLYFDTFFTTTGDPVPPSKEVEVIKDRDVVVAEVWPVGNKPAPQRRQSQGEGLKGMEKVTSFSTGPQSIPTHWKQTIFLLREPIIVEEGTVVAGTFHCRKNDTNPRELDVEIHYSVGDSAQQAATGVVVQMYKVR
ncbi:hypothetical protein PLICRDRAFT_161146 [Plicaturopsis crispa FD-325 SS-3]|nr:hypothetical protein PLICRDRAFT_161146 [Plicaturopsis crispa FD-325 SS-3]